MTDELADRVASRFDDENSESSKPEEDDKRDKSVKRAWRAQNIKESNEWTAMQFVLPDELVDSLDDEWRRIQYELGDDDLQKDRHYKPLVVQTALRTLQEMDDEQLEAAFEDLVREED